MHPFSSLGVVFFLLFAMLTSGQLYGPPIDMGLYGDQMGSASGYASHDMGLLTPAELSAIMEAQSQQAYKSGGEYSGPNSAPSEDAGGYQGQYSPEGYDGGQAGGDSRYPAQPGQGEGYQGGDYESQAHGGESYGGPSHNGDSYGGPSHGGDSYGGHGPSQNGDSYGGPAQGGDSYGGPGPNGGQYSPEYAGQQQQGNGYPGQGAGYESQQHGGGGADSYNGQSQGEDSYSGNNHNGDSYRGTNPHQGPAQGSGYQSNEGGDSYRPTNEGGYGQQYAQGGDGYGNGYAAQNHGNPQESGPYQASPQVQSGGNYGGGYNNNNNNEQSAGQYGASRLAPASYTPPAAAYETKSQVYHQQAPVVGATSYGGAHNSQLQQPEAQLQYQSAGHLGYEAGVAQAGAKAAAASNIVRDYNTEGYVTNGATKTGGYGYRIK